MEAPRGAGVSMTRHNLAMTAAWILCCSPQHPTIKAYRRPVSFPANQPEASPALLWCLTYIPRPTSRDRPVL